MPRRAKPAGSGGRTDLLTPGSQPNRVPTGLPYGHNQDLARAQKAVPLPQSPPVTAAASQPASQAGAGAPSAAPPPQGASVPQSPAAAAMPDAIAMPFRHVGLGEPSQRPYEHITTGLPGGPGQPLQLPNQQPKMADLLDKIAQASGSDQIAQLAGKARALGQ